MKNKLLILELSGIVVSVILSVIFHFMYGWTRICGWLFPVNESVFEHVKILFMPFLLFSIIEFFLIKPENPLNYFAIKSISLIVIPIIMIVLYYTYSGIIGDNYLIVDILIGFLSIIIGFLISYKLLKAGYVIDKKYIIIAAVIFFMLIIFTYFPPHINLFYDKTEGKYGI